MKKILALAVVLIIAIVSVQIITSSNSHYLDVNGYAVTNPDIDKSLFSEDKDEIADKVDAAAFKSGEKIAENKIGMFLGQDRVKLEKAYPLFVNNGEKVMTLNDTANIVNADLKAEKSFEGMYLTAGGSFTVDNKEADTGEYILLALENKINVNVDVTTIHSNIGDINVPINSLLNLSEKYISWYALKDGIFVFNSTSAIGAQTKITIGSHTYKYSELIARLDEISKGKDKEEADSSSEILNGGDLVSQDIGSLSGPSSATSTIISESSLLDDIETDDGTGSDILDDVESELGTIDDANPVISKKPDVAPSEMPPVSGASGSTGASEIAPPDGEEPEYGDSGKDPDFIMPVVSFGEFKLDVYNIATSVNVEDPANRLTRPVRIEAYINQELHMRKSTMVSLSDLDLSPLRPDTEYKIVCTFDYENAWNNAASKSVVVGHYKTNSIDTLTPIEAEIQTVGVFQDYITFENIHIVNKQDARVDYTAEAIGKAQILAETVETIMKNEYTFPISSLELDKLKASATSDTTASFVSAPVLVSNSEYKYTFKIVDRFGNTLPQKSVIDNEARTCKVPPKSSVTVVVNKIGLAELDINIINQDNAEIDKEVVKLFDADGNILSLTLKGETEPKTEFEIIGDHANLQFIDIDERIAVFVKVFAEYDVNNDLGMQTQQEIGMTKFTTVPISSLGYLFMGDSVKNITSAGAQLDFELDTLRTDAVLVDMLGKIEFRILKDKNPEPQPTTGPQPSIKPQETTKPQPTQDPDEDKELVKEYIITGETADSHLQTFINDGSFEDLENGIKVVDGILSWTNSDLESKMEYTIEVNAYVSLGQKFVEVDSVYPEKQFKTLKATPTGIVENIFTTKNSVELFNVQVEDIDLAISEKVNLIIRDGKGEEVYNKEIVPNEIYERIQISDLELKAYYTIEFYAQKINLDYLIITEIINFKLPTTPNPLEFNTVDLVAGDLSLLKMQPLDTLSDYEYGSNILQEVNEETGLANVTFTKGYINALNGDIQPSEDYLLSSPILVTPGYTFGFANCNTTTFKNDYVGYAFYDSENDGIEIRPDENAPQYARHSTVVPEGAQYIRISVAKKAKNVAYFSITKAVEDSDKMTASIDIKITDEKFTVDEQKYEIRSYKNDKIVETYNYDYQTATGDNRVILQNIERSASYNPDSYKYELWIKAFGHYIMLDDIEFTAEEPIYSISNEWEFGQIMADPSSKYIVTTDIKPNNYYSTVMVTGDKEDNIPFTGTLDFQGFSFIKPEMGINAVPMSAMFYNISRTAEVKNIDIVVNEKIKQHDGNEGRTQPIICFENNGTISNVIANFKGTDPVKFIGTSTVPIERSVKLVENNKISGTIENFSIGLGGDFHVAYRFGAVCALNYGVVRNGNVSGGNLYVYGDVSSPNSCAAEGTGLAVGSNYRNASVIENVITDGSVYITKTAQGPFSHQTTNAMLSVGTWSEAGEDTASARGLVSSGDVFIVLDDGAGQVENVQRTDYGPVIHTSSRWIVDAYYHSPIDGMYQGSKNTKVSKQAFHTDDWYKMAFNGGEQFDYSPIAMGYYPQLFMDKSMPEQNLVPLPNTGNTEGLKLEEARVITQFEDYADVQFSFSGGYGEPITDIAVDNINTIINLEENVGDIRVISARVDLAKDDGVPAEYRSEYKVRSFTRTTETGHSEIVPIENPGIVLPAEFFKVVSNKEDWSLIKNDLTQNYKLDNSIDLKSSSPEEALLYFPPEVETEVENRNVFEGKLDGNGFAVRGMDLEGKYNKVADKVTGVIRDINFIGVEGLSTTDKSSSLISQLFGMADEVIIQNSSFKATDSVAALASVVSSGAVVKNCSAIDNILELESGAIIETPIMGGLVGVSVNSTIQNSFVSNVNIDSTKAVSVNSGGIVGHISGGNITNCYATGKINQVSTWGGGVVGKVSETTTIKSSWADVNIYSKGSGIGGFVGESKKGWYFGCISMGDVTATSGTNSLNAGRFSASGLGDSSENSDTYGFEDQLINGEISTEVNNTKLLLNESMLMERGTYDSPLGWSADAYDYAGIASKEMPKLYSTRGELLPDQPKVYFGKQNINIKSIDANVAGNDNIVQIEVEHPESVVIDSIEFDYLTTTVLESTANPTSTIISYKCSPDRALDSYNVTEVKYTEKSAKLSIDVRGKVDFGVVFYNEISSVTGWQNTMRTRGENYENFKITADLDFSELGSTSLITGVRANRVIGVGDITLKNYTMTRANMEEWATTLFDHITGSIENIKFDNINWMTASTKTAIGIISRMSGSMKNVQYLNSEINAGENKYVGFIGILEASPIVDNVIIKSVKVNGKFCVGGVAGKMNNTDMKNIQVNNTNVSATEEYVGGFIGHVENDGNKFGNIYVTEELVTSTKIGIYVGGMFGYAGKIDSFIEDEKRELVVSGKLISGYNYVGGIAGYVDIANGLFTKVEVNNCAIKATEGVEEEIAEIQPVQYVGGVAGRGICNDASVKNTSIFAQDISKGNAVKETSNKTYAAGISKDGGSNNLSENNFIVAYTSAGGIQLTGGQNSANNTSKDNHVYGSYNVGGIISEGQSIKSHSLDNVISTIHNFDFEAAIAAYDGGLVYSGLEDLKREAVLYPAEQNRNIGGIAGLGYDIENPNNSTNFIANISTNNTIGDPSAMNVGGIVGNLKWYSASQSLVKSCASLTNEIDGIQNVGGLVGTGFITEISNSYSGLNNISATIAAGIYDSGSNVGGLAGYLKTPYIVGDTLPINAHKIYNNYVCDTLFATDYAGGLIGRADYPITKDNNSSNIIMGDIDINSTHSGYVVGKDSTNHTSTSHNTVLFDHASINDLYAIDITDGKAAGFKLIDEESFSYEELYNLPQTIYGEAWVDGTNGMGWDAQEGVQTGWITTGLVGYYMPYIKYEGALTPYQEGKKNNTSYYPVVDRPSRGGVPIPMTPFRSLSMKADLPELSIYAAAADKINIELSNTNQDAMIVVTQDNKKIAEFDATERVISINYDFKTPITVISAIGNNEQIYEVLPEEISRKMSVSGDEWYTIIDDGIQTKDKVIKGDYLHIFNNEVLDADGNIHNLTDSKVLREAGELAAEQKTLPLWSFEFDNQELQTYKNFTVVDGLEVEGMQLVVKSDQLFAIDSGNEYQQDGFIADNHLGDDYMTVLLDSGSLADMNEPIKLPEDFAATGYGNSHIVELTNNISTDLPYVFVRYDNGTMVGFNYLTGESITNLLPTESMTFMGYVETFFNRQRSPFGGVTGYSSTTGMIENLVIKAPNGIVDELLLEEGKNVGDATNSRNDGKIGDSAANSLTDGTINGQGTEATSGSGIIAGSGSGTGALEGIEGVVGSEVVGGGKDISTGEAGGGNGATDVDGAGDATAPGTGEDKVTTLGAKERYTAVYSADKGEYEVFETQELLNGGEPVSVNEKLADTALLNELTDLDTKELEVSNENLKGVMIYTSGAVLVIGMLIGLRFYKRKKDTI